MSFWEGVRSLYADVNKVNDDSLEIEEGVLDPFLPELELKMTDEEILEAKDRWEASWQKYEPALRARQEKNEDFWLGKQYTDAETVGGIEDKTTDNLIFESLETFLPAATQRNPEAVVEGPATDGGKSVGNFWTKILERISEDLAFKLRLKRALRNWALYCVGVAQIGWSSKENDVTVTMHRPQRIVFDPNGTIAEDGTYTGEFVGVLKTEKASDLIIRFPKKKAFIDGIVEGKMGTRLNYTEWWTNDYVCWTYRREVLGKQKNPHWNYEQEQDTVDEFGQPQIQKVPGANHFKYPKMPFEFLSIYNTGKRPYDDTTLIEQNIPLQRVVNKRFEQIDKNADNTNSGLVVSGDVFTKEQATLAARELQKGGALWIPNGDVRAAYARDTGPPLPNFIYQSLQDYRQELRGIFGTTGISPQGTKGEDTVRGKIIVRGQDQDRIGGGVSEFLENFSDSIYNQIVQMVTVYYEPEDYGRVLGAEAGAAMAAAVKMGYPVSVSVKPGSLIPKDPLTQRNEAVDLWNAQALDPETLFDRLDFPNPQEAAKKLLLWKMISAGAAPPTLLFPDFPMPGAPQLGAPPGVAGAGPPGVPGAGQQPAPESQGAPSLSAVPIQ